MKKFHISHKFEEKDGEKRKLPHKKILSPFPPQHYKLSLVG